MFITCSTFRTVPSTNSFIGGQGTAITTTGSTNVNATGTVGNPWGTWPLFSTSTWVSESQTVQGTNVSFSAATTILTSTVTAGISVSGTYITNNFTQILQQTFSSNVAAIGQVCTSQTVNITESLLVYSYTEVGLTWKSSITSSTQNVTSTRQTFLVSTLTKTGSPTSTFSTFHTTTLVTGGTTNSTLSGETTSTNLVSTGNVTATDTVTTVNTTLISTTSAATTTSRWSVQTNGKPVRNTHTLTTLQGVFVTSTSTCESTSLSTFPRTSFATAVLGFQPGTAFICTGNGPAELPAFTTNAAAGNLLVAWNWSTATQTTIWAQLPTGTTQGVTTLLTTAVAHPGSLTFFTSSSYSVWSYTTLTTTVSTTIVAPFSFTNSRFSSNTFPVSTGVQTVTSYSTSTSSYTASVITPFNTAISAGTTTTRTSVAIQGTDGSLATTFSLTTAIAGYTTAAVILGIGSRTILSTTILTGPGLSFTTTTVTGQWHYDVTCPTVLVTGTGASTSTSSSTSSTQTVTAASSINGTFSFSTSNGTTGGTITTPWNFTQNLYSQPYALAWEIVTSFGSNGTAGALASVATFTAIPFMQAFIPWTATSNTFLGISAPAGMPAISLGASETGQHLSSFTDQTSQTSAITTTAWGLWGLLAWPHTTTATSTSTTGTSTVTFTFSQVDSYTSSALQQNASSTLGASVAFPTNMDERLASMTIYSTATTTTAGVPTSTTTSVSSTYSGFTYTGSFTQTFVESVQPNSTGGPASPGVGGFPKLQAGDCTMWCFNAAVSLFWNSTSTASVANMNFMGVVLGANLTTSSSTTSNLGAGVFPVYSYPGQASVVTGPVQLAATVNSSTALPIETATLFWPTPTNSIYPPVTQND